MMQARVRLFAAGVLFAAWLTFLGYLAVMAGRPIVLSRPQFLVSNWFMIARVSGSENPNREVTVLVEGSLMELLDQNRMPRHKVEIGGLAQCGHSQGWDGPGDYILPLLRGKDGQLQLAPIPLSPGYPPGSILDPAYRLRIYPATEQTLSQLRRLIKPA